MGAQVNALVDAGIIVAEVLEDGGRRGLLVVLELKIA